MSERGKRVFRFLLDPERDADVIGRIEAKQPMTGYVRELVRRDMHDERLAYAVRELATFAGYLAQVVGSGADTPMSERDGKFLTDHFERYQRAMEQVIPTIKDEEVDA